MQLAITGLMYIPYFCFSVSYTLYYI